MKGHIRAQRFVTLTRGYTDMSNYYKGILRFISLPQIPAKCVILK